MALYGLTHGSTVIRNNTDGTTEAFAPGSSEYDRYEAWLDAGNTPDPAPTIPLQFTEEERISSAVVRTTNASAAELYRLPMEQLTGYDLDLTLIGVDLGNGAMRKIKASITIKRLTGSPLQVGTTTQTVSHADTGTTGWAIVPSFSGNDGVISVTGAVGRTIDWKLYGTMVRFTPAGF